MIKYLPRYILMFGMLVLLQVFVLNNIQLSGFINPYFYVLLILILPFEIPGWMLIFVSFALGISVDLFSGTPGMHASASVFMGFVRLHLLKVISPREGYETETLPLAKYYGFGWFLKYSAILIFFHHIFLFYVEVFRLSDFFATLWRAILSTIFTLILVLLSQYFYKK